MEGSNFNLLGEGGIRGRPETCCFRDGIASMSLAKMHRDELPHSAEGPPHNAEVLPGEGQSPGKPAIMRDDVRLYGMGAFSGDSSISKKQLKSEGSSMTTARRKTALVR